VPAERHFSARKAQDGFFLIEAMVAILIFALGILGLVAMSSTAVSSQSDAQYRTDAASLADAIAGQIALGLNRTGASPAAVAANKAASLAAFAHQPAGAACAYGGGATADANVLGLVNRAAAIMPGAGAATQQIVVNPAGNFNRVEITLCWRAPSDNAWRHHTLVTYVN
jgi:type IV pilus assembly protein PilV